MAKKTCRVLLFHSLPVNDNRADADFRIAPIGLFFIAGALKDNGIETMILPILLPAFFEESKISEDYKQTLKNKIKEFSPDYMGYSFRNLYHFGYPAVNTSNLSDFFCVSQDLPVMEFIRTCSSAPMIGGGAAFSLAPELYMSSLDLDYGIQGQGETALVLLLEALNQGKDIGTIPGLVHRKGQALHKNCGLGPDQDSLCTMDLSCLNEHKAMYYDHGGYGAVQTKRGCSFHCSYCVYPYLEGTSCRLRPVSLLMQELENYAHVHHMRHIYFVDSVFSYPTGHSLAIAQALIQGDVDINWYAYVNPRGLSLDLLKTYKKSGCAGLVLTLESGNDKVLDYLNKGFTVMDSIRAIENLHASRIPFEVSMMVGTPVETQETLNHTLTFCQTHLAHVPVMFTPGVWMHPVSPIFSEQYHGENQDVDDLSYLVLNNDFKGHNELYYFFSKHPQGHLLIEQLHQAVEKEDLWFVMGKDMVPDPRNGIMSLPNTENLKRYSRPWFSGLGGYPEHLYK
ncbi:MAG: radical SAM protein [Proteobacteria bacterium]|nr:radical SAM protein [Pseudomonadota bacterium]